MSQPRPQINARAVIEARFRAGLTVADVSRTTGIHPATIYRIESGESTPRTPTAKKLADALGVDVADLLSLGAA